MFKYLELQKRILELELWRIKVEQVLQNSFKAYDEIINKIVGSIKELDTRLQTIEQVLYNHNMLMKAPQLKKDDEKKIH